MAFDSKSGQLRGFLPWISDSKKLYDILTQVSQNISRIKTKVDRKVFRFIIHDKHQHILAITSMYMPLPPVDFRTRYTSKLQILVPQPSFNTVTCNTDNDSSASRTSGSFLLSNCLARLEETRDMALKVQDEIQLLWTTLTHDSSLTRSTLPHLHLSLYSDPTFCRLRCLVDDLDISIASWMARNLKPEYPDLWGFHCVAAVVSHEREWIALFCHKWQKLTKRLQHVFLAGIMWSKEVYDLLETAFRNLQHLQNHLGDIHYDIHMFLRPRMTSEIRSTKFASEATSASVEFPKHETKSVLRRRGHGAVEGANKTLDLQDGCFLLKEMEKMR